jgi:hypothetical protein
MGEITRDRDVSPIHHFAASGAEVSNQTGLPVSLSIVLISGIERARPKWNSQYQVDRRGSTHAGTRHGFSGYAGLSLSEKISAIDRKSEDHRSRASKKVPSLQLIIHYNHQYDYRWLESRDNPGTCQVRAGSPSLLGCSAQFAAKPNSLGPFHHSLLRTNARPHRSIHTANGSLTQLSKLLLLYL